MQMPHVSAAISGPTFVAGKQAEVLEAQAVDAERPRGDGDDARRQPVEAVDQVDRVAEREHPHRGDDRKNRWPEHDEAREGQLQLIHRRAEK